MKKSLPVSVLSYRQMEQILDDDTGTVGPGEEHLAALTAHDRTSWAVAREQFFSKGVNRQSMEMIEKAAYVLFFEDSSPNLLNKVSELSQWALIGSSSTITDNAKMIVYLNQQSISFQQHGWYRFHKQTKTPSKWLPKHYGSHLEGVLVC